MRVLSYRPKTRVFCVLSFALIFACCASAGGANIESGYSVVESVGEIAGVWEGAYVLNVAEDLVVPGMAETSLNCRVAFEADVKTDILFMTIDIDMSTLMDALIEALGQGEAAKPMVWEAVFGQNADEITTLTDDYHMIAQSVESAKEFIAENRLVINTKKTLLHLYTEDFNFGLTDEERADITFRRVK